MPDTPSNDDLSAIKRAMPHLMNLRGQRKAAEQNKKKPINGHLCHICGETFKVLSDRKDHRNFCLECRTRLENGMTCMVCMSGRYIFLAPNPEAPAEVKKVAGQVIRVTVETMDFAMAKHRSETGEADVSKN